MTIEDKRNLRVMKYGVFGLLGPPLALMGFAIYKGGALLCLMLVVSITFI
jgi:hypothetical protein